MTDVAVRFKIEGDSRSARRSADEAGGAFGGSVLQHMAHGALDIIDFAPWVTMAISEEPSCYCVG